jgi:hypothetical protein
MVQASQLTHWGCPNHGLGEKEVVKHMDHVQKPKHHGIPSPLTQSLAAQVKTPEVRRLKRDTTKSQNPSTKMRPKRNTNDKKHKRSKREASGNEDRKESFQHPKKKEVDFKKSENGHEKFLKYEEKEDAG